MGRRKRKHKQYKNIQRLYDHSRAQDQQEQQLDQEEAKLLSKQLWVTCLARDVTEATVMSEFNRRFGGVLQVRMHSSSNNAPPGQALMSSLPNGYRVQQPRIPLPRAVVEFTDPQYARAVLEAQSEVGIFSMQNGQRTTKRQRVLAAGAVGHLKEPCNCRRYRPACHCPGYVHVAPNRPTPNQSYHRGGAGQHSMAVVHLQIGSLGEDGETFRPELDQEASCSVSIDLQQRNLVINAPLEETAKYLLVNQFRHLRQRLSVDEQSRTLTFTVKQPPKILRYLSTCSSCGGSLGMAPDKGPVHEVCGDPTAKVDYGLEGQQCNNCVAESVAGYIFDMPIDGMAAAGTKPAGIVGAGAAGADGVLGRCMTYKLTLQKSAVEELFSDSNKLLRKLRSFRLLRTVQRYRQQHKQQQQSSGRDQLSALDTELAAASTLAGVDFDVRYHVLVLMSSGVATPWQVGSGTFSQHLEQAARADSAMTCKALAELSAFSTPVRDLAQAFQVQLTGLRQEAAMVDNQPQSTRSDLYKVLRVHVTPTRVKFLLPEVQTGNRVVRHFCAETAGTRTYSSQLACLEGLQFSTGHFLRVSFGDEGGDRMLGNREESLAPFFDRMKYVLQKGLLVNGRKYNFLAFSSSQLKAWSVWMVADPEQGQFWAAGSAVIAEALRHWLGDAMETEHVAAKCAARLGQAFSATIDAAGVQHHEVSRISDVEQASRYSFCRYMPARNSTVKYCFSDGVGRISSELLDEVLEALPFVPADSPQISAIQVRFQGCKGVLSRYSQLHGRQLQLRPSMEKFGSNHPRLEVCSVAACLPAYLNRVVTIMMESNGVNPEVFLRKLDSTLDQLARMCCSTKAALELLPALGGIETGAQDAMLRLLDVSARCGLPLDPLADSCLKAVARSQVTDLRQKARLLVPDAVTLVGVMDEYGVLEEDEVFVQVQRPYRGSLTPPQPTIIAGMTVLLAKHPVAHRGDVRRVTAVDPRRHNQTLGARMVADYVNVVVFSQKGRRPLPNQLSGSDLDGDQYMVLWDQELLQPGNSEPMDYTAEPPDKVDHVTVQHLQDHFVNFAKNDNLGQISTWLLAQADLKGAACSACETLAQLHSMAVDFPKTGRPAVIRAEQLQELVPTKYPHWMEKRDRETYESATILGQMYDRVMQHPLTKCLLGDDRDSSSTADPAASGPGTITALPTDGQATWPALLLSVSGITPAYKQHLQRAEFRLMEFESEMVALMNHWGVYDVGEMVTGCLRRPQRKPGQHHKQSEQRDQLNLELRCVFSRARRRFLQDLLLLSGLDADSEGINKLSIRALDAQISEWLSNARRSNGSGSFGESIRLQYAAAYMVVAHKLVIREQQQHHKQHPRHSGGLSPGATGAGTSAAQHAAVTSTVSFGDGSDSDDGDDEDDLESESDDALDEEWLAGGQSEQQGTKKQQEVKGLVRLCFQWVVAKELQELGWLLTGDSDS